jgi:hypothetical protein
MVEYSSLTPGMDEAPVKRLYHAPHLQDYGKMDVLTLSHNTPGAFNDGGNPPFTYTSIQS